MSRLARSFVAALVAVLAVSAAAQEAPPDIELETGPGSFDLGEDLAEIALPEGYLFADGPTSRRIMERMGNPPTDQEIGLVAPHGEEADWFVIFEFDPTGYVRDDEKESIDADAILESIRAADEEGNRYRREHGHPQLFLQGWLEEPHYDEATHNLVWATTSADESGRRVANYNVRLLGRRGVTSAILVADPEMVPAIQPELDRLIASFSYKPGQRYAEYRRGDRVAEIGLTALIAGGAGAAAAKLGLFGKLGKFLAASWKLVVAGLVGLGAALRRLFRRGKAEPAGAP